MSETVSSAPPSQHDSVPTQESRARSDHDYYPWFDLLRAACASAVLLYHDGVLHWTHAGNYAVQIFFALSGWLIGGMLIHLKPRDMTRFYFNRSIRIWIPYYLTAAMLLTVSVLREPVTAKWLEIVAYKLTFVYNLFGTQQLAAFGNVMPQKATLNHFWSVNAEEQFYLLAPLLLVWVGRYFGRSILLWIAIALATLYFDTYAAIVCGVVAALVVDRFGPVHLSVAGRLAAAVVLLAGIFCFSIGFEYETVAPVSAVCVVLLLAMPGPRFRFGEILGGMSYPLYLNQWIGGFLFNYLAHFIDFKGHTKEVLSFTFNVALAMAFYWWIDRRLLARRSAWYTPGRGSALTFTAYGLIAVGLAYGLWMTTRG
jgi:peptidoglycan/LPS O-acetylase OafA/YrhL